MAPETTEAPRSEMDAELYADTKARLRVRHPMNPSIAAKVKNVEIPA